MFENIKDYLTLLYFGSRQLMLTECVTRNGVTKKEFINQYHFGLDYNVKKLTLTQDIIREILQSRLLRSYW